MRRPVPLLLGILLLLVAPLGAAGAQRARLEISLPPQQQLTTEGPLVRSLNVLRDSRTRDFLRNGFPVRLHFRVERWSTGGWLNDLEARTEWDVIVRLDPLSKSYRIARVDGERAVPLGEFPDVGSAEAALARPVRAPLTAERGQRQYYVASLEIETLSLNDLDEVERWLRGELQPAVRGQRNPGTAVTRGVRTLLVKLLGGEKQAYEVRTATFRP